MVKLGIRDRASPDPAERADRCTKQGWKMHPKSNSLSPWFVDVRSMARPFSRCSAGHRNALDRHC